jgi:flavin-dependent dehydrogenase
MYYRYVRDFPGPTGPADGAEFSFIGDEIVYVFPSDAGVSCIALSLNLDDYATVRKAAEQQVDLRIARHVGVAGRYTAATQEGRLLGCGPETNYVRVPTGPGWALVGDAGVHQDPWSGQGIDCAAVHASMLTDALHQWFSGEQTETEALAEYHRRRNEHALDIYHRTVMLGRDLRQLRTG